MSKFLAPIHTWLFNKIVLLESIERDIHNAFKSETTEIFLQELIIEKGNFLPNVPLEDIIDQNNIHGWLQNRINIAETRQAAFVSYITALDPNALQRLTSIYYEKGIETATAYNGSISEPSEIFKAINDNLLEGMPCDRVNSVVEQTPERLIWNTMLCVHKNNWENNGVEVSVYYGFRAAFIEGFVFGINKDYTYIYTNDMVQQHQILV